MRDYINPYTPHTLSYIVELMRPEERDGELIAPLSDEQIFKFGSASLYLFFKTSMKYFMETFQVQEYKSQTMFVRDLIGKEYHLQATTTHEFDLNGNQSISFSVLPTKVNKEFIDDISEMWEVIDDKGVLHKIIYCKKQGVGQHSTKMEYRESDHHFLTPAQVVNGESKGNPVKEKRLKVEIKAIPLFFDVMDNSRIYEEYNEHMPAQRAFARIFEGVPFEFIIVGQFDAVEWEGFGAGESRLETFKRALERYKMEFRIVGNIVYLERQVGRDTSFQYRHKLNASNIVKEIDAREFWTYAKGYGNFGNEGEGEGESSDWQDAKLTREYTSPLAKVIGKRDAPPVKDGRITDETTMDRGLKELVEDSLKISITTDIHDLRKQGYALAQPEIGDRVFIIDERIGLDEEVRVIDMSVTKDWRGNVTALSLTIGSEGLSKRHQTNISTAAKQINELIEGRRELPFSVLDEAVKNATKALQSAQTELIFGNGIIGKDKKNPNYLTVFNSRGLGVSNDGGNTFTEAIIAGLGINASAVVTGTMLADFIAGGTLASLNGNLNFDMNNGDFDMKRANFTLGSGARIDFTSVGNRITYERTDKEDNQKRTAGYGVGRAYNERFPYVFMGATGTSKHSLDPSDENYFSGFIANTTKRESEDEIGNSVVGYRFHIRDLPVSYTKGFEFNINGSTNVFRGMNTGSVDYNLGDENSLFNQLFVRRVKTSGGFEVRNNSATDIGYLFETSSGLHFRGLNGDRYQYDLGSKESRNHWNRGYINYLQGAASDSGVGNSDNPYRYGHIQELTVQTIHDSSRKDVKLNIEPLEPYVANDFIDMSKVNSFNYRDSDLTNKFSLRAGLVIEQLDPTNDKLYKADEDSLDVSSIIYLLLLSLQDTRKDLKELEEYVYEQ